MNNQMIVWLLTVGVLFLAFIYAAIEKWHSTKRNQEFIDLNQIDYERMYEYDYEDFDNYEGLDDC